MAENNGNGSEKLQDMQMSLTDMIAGMIQATIDADQAVTEDYLDAFTKYAFEESDTPGGHDKLAMVDFEMTDNEGHRQIVSIPKLSLLPLPVLHVQEATFDFEAQMSYRETTEEEKEQIRRQVEAVNRPIKTSVADLVDRAQVRRQPSIRERERLLSRQISRQTASRLVLRLNQNPTAKQTTSKESEQNINVKVHIKLQPAQLSSGMRGLLQEADTSMQIVAKKDENEKP